MSVQYGLFHAGQTIVAPRPRERWTPPPPPVLTPRQRAYALEHHIGCDSDALRASWPTPDRYLPADRLSDVRVAELLSLFERQLGGDNDAR